MTCKWTLVVTYDFLIHYLLVCVVKSKLIICGLVNIQINYSNWLRRVASPDNIY